MISQHNIALSISPLSFSFVADISDIVPLWWAHTHITEMRHLLAWTPSLIFRFVLCYLNLHTRGTLKPAWLQEGTEPGQMEENYISTYCWNNTIYHNTGVSKPKDFVLKGSFWPWGQNPFRSLIDFCTASPIALLTLFLLISAFLINPVNLFQLIQLFFLIYFSSNNFICHETTERLMLHRHLKSPW